MKTLFITGANKGIGFETARQSLQKGFYVYLGSRNLQNGKEAAEKLQAEGYINVEAIQIDVTDQVSVNEARTEIAQKTEILDVLINNAGISGKYPQPTLNTDIEVFKEVFDTNVYGVVRVTVAFIDLLRKSSEPRIVNVSSGQGSLGLASDPMAPYYHYKGAVYPASKSALNMYTINLAYELKDTNIKVNLVCPGFTKTDFTGHEGTGTVKEASERILKYALIGNDGPTGQFFCEEILPFTTCPW
ncbi:Short-chain dehydrogenase [Gillisia sp. Hel1_33_143]|uniref:SDR family oxidoreductase n=1 Tax=Gillisia sp. Hel1_33_143 TaxID=1336796 RepID=UPI000879EF18|nr:SDR family oxidoreductase [Gillisia sp. Hel1_33_143]SDR99500.1 Short-chain dehydrogenase [Gillisia sp. Hel1_33_143]